jgi:hypothetical protein
VIYTVWSGLFDIDPENGLSLESAWIALGAMTGVAVWLLLRRVRAFEVVK